jgi:hypothetical protein
MPATPPPVVFDVPELVELVAQYLSRQDIVHYTATSKSCVHQFMPFLWRHIVLKKSYPAPHTLALNRHRIRSLSVASNDVYNLRTLAADLPNTRPCKRLAIRLARPTTTGNNIFQNLCIICVDYDSGKNSSYWESPSLEYVLCIIKQSPGLLKLVAPGNILGESVPRKQTESFLYTLAHKLPCIKELDIRGEGFPPRLDSSLCECASTILS